MNRKKLQKEKDGTRIRVRFPGNMMWMEGILVKKPSNRLYIETFSGAQREITGTIGDSREFTQVEKL